MPSSPLFAASAPVPHVRNPFNPWEADQIARDFEMKARVSSTLPPSGEDHLLTLKEGIEPLNVPMGENAVNLWPGAPYVVILGSLGSGGFGTCFKARRGGTDMALKVSVNDSGGRVAWANEIAVLRRLKDVEGVAQLREATCSADYVFLLLELGDFGCLSSYAPEDLELTEILRLVIEIGTTLAAVHARGVVHLDLKQANVVLKKCNDGLGPHPLLIDWGLSAFLDVGGFCAPRRESTEGYGAPEQLGRQMLTPWVDIWALGLMIVELVEGKGTDIQLIVYNAEAKGAYTDDEFGEEWSIVPTLGWRDEWAQREAWNTPLGQTLKGVARDCLALTPHQRPQAWQIVGFLRDYECRRRQQEELERILRRQEAEQERRWQRFQSNLQLFPRLGHLMLLEPEEGSMGVHLAPLNPQLASGELRPLPRLQRRHIVVRYEPYHLPVAPRPGNVSPRQSPS